LSEATPVIVTITQGDGFRKGSTILRAVPLLGHSWMRARARRPGM